MFVEAKSSEIKSETGMLMKKRWNCSSSIL